MMEQKERVMGMDSSSIFKFKLEEKLTCLQCQKARCRHQEALALMLPVPAKSSGLFLENGKPEYLPVTLRQILDGYFAGETREFHCPHDKTNVFSER
jgi:ubiquitin carboxyl-terminal hydrolase 5/13